MKFEKSVQPASKREDKTLEIYGNTTTSQDVTNADIWLTNHNCITAFISGFVSEHGMFPQITSIARGTGVSRKTVSKHLERLSIVDVGQMRMQQFSVLRDSLLLDLYDKARGNFADLKATKLFIDTVTKMEQRPKNQTIIINNTQFNLNVFNELAPEAKKQIEMILMNEGVAKG